MRIQFDVPKSVEFTSTEPDNLILVENHPDQVMVRAARNNFSERRKLMFIRHLAAEGFIPEHYKWYCGPGDYGSSAVNWVTDHSWLSLSPEAVRRSNRFMRTLFVCAILLLMMLMALAFLRVLG